MTSCSPRPESAMLINERGCRLAKSLASCVHDSQSTVVFMRPALTKEKRPSRSTALCKPPVERLMNENISDYYFPLEGNDPSRKKEKEKK